VFFKGDSISRTEVPKEITELAERLCNKSGFSRYPMSAVIYKFKKNKSVVISTGVNRHLFIGQTKQTRGKYGTPYSIHAERDAIMGCSKQDLYGAHIYVHRKGYKLARPCIKCMNLIMSTGINHIHWSNGGI